jgi:hypothetical protein
MIRIITLTLLLAAMGCNSAYHDIYVSPEGNDLKSGTKRSPFASLDRALEELVDISGNVVFDSDPGFVDFPAGDLSLKPNAAVFEEINGFEEVPFGKMGLVAPAGPEGISK